MPVIPTYYTIYFNFKEIFNVDVFPVYVLQQGWRILLNGRNVEYEGGFGLAVEEGDTIAVFPPGR